ncbi:uridine kinase [Duganella sp. S19_KUP01_CR8]|uniref:uridine kinase n=2 Tax=Duganella TaxID=75654 RepID=UPI002FCDDA78
MGNHQSASQESFIGDRPVPVSSVTVPVSFGMNTISFQPFIIGVAGGSGSGKSTVSQKVLAAFGADMVSVVMQDDYYCDQTHLSPEVRPQQNYDHPQAFEWSLLVQHIQALRNGESIEMPEYDFTLHNRSDRTIPVKPAPVIVIEGLFALYDADLCDMMSLKIYVDTASDIRFIRRMQRDITERGRSVESVVSQYLETVRPMHKQFIEPTKRNADIIIPHGANGPAVDMITTKVASVIDQLKRP